MSDRAQGIATLHNFRIVRPLHFGLSNETYAVIDTDGNTCVLKTYLRDTFKAAREVAFMSSVGTVVPIPQCLAYGDDYILTSFCEGVSGAELFSIPSEWAVSMDVGAQIGRMLAQIHAAEVLERGIGFLGKDMRGYDAEYALHVSDAKTNTALLKRLINENVTILESNGVTLPALPNICVSRDTERVLVHHDMCPKNMLFVDGRLNAVLDFEYALVGSRLFDVAKVYILGRYLAYHTGGVSMHLAYDAYEEGFDAGYGTKFTFEELQPFYIYVLLNYITFWVTHPAPNRVLRERIVPIHIDNLRRVCRGEGIVVPTFIP